LSGTGGWLQAPVAGSHARSCVHELLSGGHTVVMWVWTHCPASQPALVHALLSESVHGVLSGTGGWLQAPGAGALARSWVHALLSGVQTVVMGVWTHCPAAQPALVHALPSECAHGVLSGTGGWLQAPVAGSHARSLVHSLLSGGQTVVMW